MARPHINRLEKRKLQHLFNGELLAKVLCGKLESQIETDRVPRQRVLEVEPAGTRSQTLSYWDKTNGKREFVALIHRYLRPDGKIGRSGLPDPKKLVFDGERYALDNAGQPR